MKVKFLFVFTDSITVWNNWNPCKNRSLQILALIISCKEVVEHGLPKFLCFIGVPFDPLISHFVLPWFKNVELESLCFIQVLWRSIWLENVNFRHFSYLIIFLGSMTLRFLISLVPLFCSKSLCWLIVLFQPF